MVSDLITCLMRIIQFSAGPASFGGLFYFKTHMRCRLLALSGQSDRTRVCPLLDKSGQSWIFARDGLSAYDPQATFGVEGADQQDGPQRRTRHRADDAAELTRESRHTFLFKANHKRATASEGVEYNRPRVWRRSSWTFRRLQ